MGKFKLFCALFVLTISTANAQTTEKGELISGKGDTLTIYVINKPKVTNKQKITYKKYLRSKEKLMLKPEEIRSFSSDLNHMVSMKKPNETESKFILTKLVNGYVNLYSATDRYGDEIFYFSKNEEELIEIKKTDFEQFIEDNFSHCQARNIKRRAVYEAFYFKNIISSYNACMKPERHVYVESKFNKEVSIGVKVGLNYSSIVFEKFKTDNQLGYWAGVYLNAELSPMFSLQFEFSYNQRKSKTTDATFDNNYLQVPILLQIQLFDHKIKPFINFGPTLNYVTSNEMDYNPDLRFKIQKRLSEFSFGYSFSAGLPLKITNSKEFIFELRFDRILNSTEVSQLGPASLVQNSSIQCSVGIPL